MISAIPHAPYSAQCTQAVLPTTPMPTPTPAPAAVASSQIAPRAQSSEQVSTSAATTKESVAVGPAAPSAAEQWRNIHQKMVRCVVGVCVSQMLGTEGAPTNEAREGSRRRAAAALPLKVWW